MNAEDGNMLPGGNRDENSFSLKEYISIRFDIVEKNVEKAQIANNERLGLLNESRASIEDSVQRNITRLEVEEKMKTQDIKISVVDGKCNDNSTKIANIEGRATAIGIGFSVTTLAVSIWLHFVK